MRTVADPRPSETPEPTSRRKRQLRELLPYICIALLIAAVGWLWLTRDAEGQEPQTAPQPAATASAAPVETPSPTPTTQEAEYFGNNAFYRAHHFSKSGPCAQGTSSPRISYSDVRQDDHGQYLMTLHTCNIPTGGVLQITPWSEDYGTSFTSELLTIEPGQSVYPDVRLVDGAHVIIMMPQELAGAFPWMFDLDTAIKDSVVDRTGD